MENERGNDARGLDRKCSTERKPPAARGSGVGGGGGHMIDLCMRNNVSNKISLLQLGIVALNTAQGGWGV